jgi:hypothetical protein
VDCNFSRVKVPIGFCKRDWRIPHSFCKRDWEYCRHVGEQYKQYRKIPGHHSAQDVERISHTWNNLVFGGPYRWVKSKWTVVNCSTTTIRSISTFLDTISVRCCGVGSGPTLAACTPVESLSIGLLDCGVDFQDLTSFGLSFPF